LRGGGRRGIGSAAYGGHPHELRGVAITALITDERSLGELIERLQRVERYALDTEFHRERTYWPALALLQVAWPDSDGTASGLALIDPQAVDIRPLAALMEAPATMVAHAADQDLEILERYCGRGPSRLFDTQLAAGFVGYSAPSLSTLSRDFLGWEVPKGDRLTDWRARPLTDSQIAYAAADVEHLLLLADRIAVELAEEGRSEWAAEECETLRSRPHGSPTPQRAWWKLRDARSLRGPARGVAQEVAAWRERRAQEIDQPVRSVLPDLAVQAIAHRPPTTPAGLQRIRGMEGRQLRPAVAADLLSVIERGRTMPAEQLELPPADDVPRELRAGVALVMAWIAQVARDARLDPALLATRGDVAGLLRRDPTTRLSTGWRGQMLAEPINGLIEGRAALSFDGGDRLVLEERSGRPLRPVLPSNAAEG
jgi:ribonuclease D